MNGFKEKLILTSKREVLGDVSFYGSLIANTLWLGGLGFLIEVPKNLVLWYVVYIGVVTIFSFIITKQRITKQKEINRLIKYTQLLWLLETAEKNSLTGFEILDYLTNNTEFSSFLTDLEDIYEWLNFNYPFERDLSLNLSERIKKRFKVENEHLGLLRQIQKEYEDFTALSFAITIILPLALLFTLLFDLSKAWIIPFFGSTTIVLAQGLSLTTPSLLLEVKPLEPLPIQFFKNLRDFGNITNSPHELVILANEKKQFSLTEQINMDVLIKSSQVSNPLLQAITFQLLLQPDHKFRNQILEELLLKMEQTNDHYKVIKQNKLIIQNRFYLLLLVLSLSLGLFIGFIPIYLQYFGYENDLVFYLIFCLGVYLVVQGFLPENPLYSTTFKRVVAIMIITTVFIFTTQIAGELFT